jgi:Domain amino terminal to FKBP-type peptidyl-prolyl isomerase
LEQTRQFVLSKTAQVADLFNTLTIGNEEIEQFQARLHSNITLRLYRDRTVPQTFTQAVASRWENAKTAASELICAPDSWGKKLQYHFISVIFFILPTLSVEFSQQKNQLWTGLGILTAILASVGLAKSALPVLPKDKKQSIWQRLKHLFGKSDCCLAAGIDNKDSPWAGVQVLGRCLGIVYAVIWLAHCVIVAILLFASSFPLWLAIAWISVVTLLTALTLFHILTGRESTTEIYDTECGSWAHVILLFITMISPLFTVLFMLLYPVSLVGLVLLGLVLIYFTLAVSDSVTFMMERRAEKKSDKISEKNEAASKEFFAKNAQRPEVKTLADGSQYEILNEGDPQKPRQGNNVVGIAESNSPGIESSRYETKNRDQLNNKMRSMVELLPNVGSKAKFYVPPSSEFGVENLGTFYEIEVLDVYDPEIFTTPSGLRYQIKKQGNRNKPLEPTEDYVVEKSQNCPAKTYYSCEKQLIPSTKFKEGSFEKEAYDLMKYQGAEYHFYLPDTQSLETISFIIKIVENK